MASVPVFNGRHVREVAHEKVRRSRVDTEETDLNVRADAGQKFVDPDFSPLPRRRDSAASEERSLAARLLQVFSPKAARPKARSATEHVSGGGGVGVERPAYPMSMSVEPVHRSVSCVEQRSVDGDADGHKAGGGALTPHPHTTMVDFTEIKRRFTTPGSLQGKFAVYAGVDADTRDTSY